MIQTNDIRKARDLIKKESKPVIVLSQNEVFDRKMLESGGFDILLSPEKNSNFESTRQLESGLNHVLAKIASKNKVSIWIDLEEIKGLSKREKAIRLSKIAQNLKICRKTNTKVHIDNSGKDLLLSLGASTTQI